MKTINKPDWLDLKKYKPFKNLSIKEWEAQLYVRSTLNLHFNLLDDNHPDSQSYQRAVDSCPLPFSVQDIQDCPIVSSDQIQSGWEYSGYPDLSSVGLVKGYDASWPYFVGEYQNNNDIKTSIEKLRYENRKFDEQCGLYKLWVNLNAPDKLLEEDFKKCLKQLREKKDEDDQMKNPKKLLSKLLDHHVVPFIDIALWARQSNIKLKDAVVGNWLYPDNFEIDITGKIRQTTRILAGIAMSNRLSIALRFEKE